MNDYWNDPPESPDPPACPNDKPSSGCPGSGEYLYDGATGHVFSCDTCGYQWVVPFSSDQEPPPPDKDVIEPAPVPEFCPHGKAWGSCDACDHAADIAYDAQREMRSR